MVTIRKMMEKKLKEHLQIAYDLKAEERNGLTISDWRLKPRNDFAARLKQEGKVSFLELGSGPGKDGRYFQDQGFDVLCTDLSPEMVRLCQQKGLKAVVMDNTNIDLPAASFDAVYAMNSLLHLPKQDLPTVLTAIQTLLKPTGLFFMGVYGGKDTEGIWQDDHYQPKRFFSSYSDASLQQILAAYFDIVSFQSIAYKEEEPDLLWQAAVLRKQT